MSHFIDRVHDAFGQNPIALVGLVIVKIKLRLDSSQN